MRMRTSVAIRILAVLAAAVILTLSGAMAWAVANDYTVRGLVPKGVTVVGKDVSGMTASRARKVIESAVSAPMLRPLTVTGDKNKTWTLDAAKYVSVDVDAMLYDAYSTRREATFIERLNSDLRGVPLPKDVKPKFSIDSSGVAAWVNNVARKTNRPAIDSTRTIVGYAFKISKCADGVKTDKDASTETIVKALDPSTALGDQDRSVALSLEPVKPKVTPKSFGKAIIVGLSETTIYLYDGDKLEKSYSCAPGQPDWPTPTGDFKIISKQKDAPWYNPHSAWSASMPEVIPGGPNNPMGDTKIGIDFPGVYMHAVPPSEFDSIGSFASHGCMRMMPSAVHDLYDRVEIGMQVFIRD